MKRGRPSGIFTRANFVRRPCRTDDSEVLAAVRNERERMSGIEGQRRQQRKNLVSHALCEERQRAQDRLIEHALVELEPAELAIDVGSQDRAGRPELPRPVVEMG